MQQPEPLLAPAFQLASTDTATTNQLLRDSVVQTLQAYFTELGDHAISNLYELGLADDEAPLLETVLRQVIGNQTKASDMLGLSRGTLRKKLKHYKLD